MAISRTEVKAVVKLLEDESNGELDSVQMAEKIIETINGIREKSAKWASVGILSIGETDDHKGTHGMFVVGPFSTQLQARNAGVGLSHSGKYWSSKGKWQSVPIVSNARSAWDALKPKYKDEYEHIREYIKAREIEMFGEEWFAEKRGW
jgi:hypothetical protein